MFTRNTLQLSFLWVFCCCCFKASSLSHPRRNRRHTTTSEALHALNNAWECYKTARKHNTGSRVASHVERHFAANTDSTNDSESHQCLQETFPIVREAAQRCLRIVLGPLAPQLCSALWSRSLLCSSALPLHGSLHWGGETHWYPRLMYGLMKMFLVTGQMSSAASLVCTGGEWVRVLLFYRLTGKCKALPLPWGPK